MDTARLVTASFWEDETPEVLWNDRVHQRDEALESWLAKQPELKDHLLFATSGTTQNPKWVALSKRAILASAKAVNQHLKVKNGDRWFRALPAFHVGGIGLYARAYLSDGQVISMKGKWNVAEFVEQLERSKSQWVSLVPTQLSDLVTHGSKAPVDLRGVIIGGGGAKSNIVDQAIGLGWPVLQSYGMSEAASQIATAVEVGGSMKLLQHLDVRLNAHGLLEWRGSSQMSGYVKEFHFEPVAEWVTTNDRVKIEGDTLTFLNRSDRVVKILGELVDVDELESRINSVTAEEVVLKVILDERRGAVLQPYVEVPVTSDLETSLSQYKGLESLEPVAQKTFPRNVLGKVIRYKI